MRFVICRGRGDQRDQDQLSVGSLLSDPALLSVDVSAVQGRKSRGGQGGHVPQNVEQGAVIRWRYFNHGTLRHRVTKDC